MQIPETCVLEYPFFRNYYCYIPNTNFAFLVISKNACTFLKRVALYNHRKFWMKGRNETHDTIGNNPKNSEFLFTATDIEEFKKSNPELKVFAVWRDPVERLVSVYKQFILEREYNEYFTWMGFYNRHIPFEEFLRFAKFELSKPDPLFQDEHIRMQSDYLGERPITDFIIHINKLFAFLEKENIKFVYEKSNSTSSSFKLNNKRLIERTKMMYAADYNISVNYII